MKGLMMMAFAFLLLGCGTINKDKLFSKQKLTETLSQESSETLLAERTLSTKDSSNATVELAIWPKGVFKYSATTGFEGEAFKMEVRARQSLLSQSNELATSKKETATKLKLQKEQVAKLKEKEVEWKGATYGIGFLLLLLVVFVFWSVRKRLM